VRIAAVACALAIAGRAHADNPRDVFGFKPKTNDKPLDCRDARDFGCAQITDDLADDTVPFALSTWLSAAYLLSLPTADATHDAVASYALGASRDEAGATFAGANGLENRWTVDGSPADSVRTGAADTRIPLVFLDGIMVTAGGFGARDRTSTGGTIDARLKRGTEHHELDARVWLGWTGLARHMPITTQSYQVRRGEVDPGSDATLSLVATGPLGAHFGGTTWYAAGIAPAFAHTDFKFAASSIADADGDGLADGLPGYVTTVPIEAMTATVTNWALPAMARVGLDRGVHHVDLTLVGSGASSTRFLFNSTLQAGGVDATNIIGDGIATYRGEWADTRVRVQAAWHRSMHYESARDPEGAAIPQLLTAYIPQTLSDDPVLASHCADGGPNDPFPSVTNCPVPLGWFTSGGAGPLTDITGDRPSLTAEVAHRIDHNVVRVGATGEDARLVTETRFTGGQQLRSLFDGEISQRHFIDSDTACPQDPSRACLYVDRSTLTYRTRYTAAYAEDTWRPDSQFAVDGGLRWELMWVGPVMHFSNELAPRLGLNWDPWGKGRTRVWASMGRSFALLPAGLGSTILGRDRVADDFSFNGIKSRTVDTGAPLLVTPDVEPLAQDELTLGGEIALFRQLRARAWLQGRWLRRGLESTPEGFDNPGHFDASAPAIRETGLFAIELETAPGANVARVGYMYGRTQGNWTGAYNPREGAVLYNSTDFDLTSINQFGPLPTDLGHRVYVEGERSGRLGVVAVRAATRITAASGRPRDALADTADGIEYIIQRGAAGRSPVQTQVNLRLGATWRGTDFTLDLFDLFDRRDATNLDSIYTGGNLHPIEGGTYEDLIFLRNDAGAPATRRTAYNVGTAFQGPFSAVLGVRRAF
jgi:hypothetical protein